MSSLLASRGAKSVLTVFALFCLFLTVYRLPFSSSISESWTQSQPLVTHFSAVPEPVVSQSYAEPTHHPTTEWHSPTPEPTSSLELTSTFTSHSTSTHSSSIPDFSSPPSDFEHVDKSSNKQLTFQLTDDEAETLCKKNHFEVHPNRTERKVYDLFLAGSELEWLEIRLNTLDPVVDYFVIVESGETFTNLPKPLYFKDNYSMFEKFADKIIYRVVDFAGMEANSTWEREKFQRDALFNAVFPGLVGEQTASDGDVLLVSDLDEIPKEPTITMLKNCKFPERVTIRSQFYYYSFQWQHHGGDWNHPQATFFQGNDTIRPEDLRMGPGYRDLQNASWHCSSCLSSVAKFQQKIEGFSHTEYNHARFKDPAQIVRRVRNGIDLFDRGGQDYDKIVDNQDLPTYLKTHADRFPWVVDRDPPNANFIDFEGEGAKSLEEFTEVHDD